MYTLKVDGKEVKQHDVVAELRLYAKRHHTGHIVIYNDTGAIVDEWSN